MSHLHPGASRFQVDPNDTTHFQSVSTDANDNPLVLFQCTSLGEMLRPNKWVRAWAFDELPSYQRANIRDRRDALLQFQMANEVTRSKTQVASAAILGTPLEFKCRMTLFSRIKSWLTVPIQPRHQLLTKEQIALGPQPIHYWLRENVFIGIFGKHIRHQLLEYIS